MDIGVTAAGLTVSVVWPDFPVAGSVAVIVIVPAVTAWANPLSILPVIVLMVAIPVFEDVQVTDDVKFCVVASEYIPVAING